MNNMNNVVRPNVVLKKKVYSLITRGSELLVFRQPTHPEAGIQIPGGTVEPDEMLEIAVMREAQEETGLTNLRLITYLGQQLRDMTKYYGEPRYHECHFYHLVCEQECPVTWQHIEQHPSEGDEKTVLFELFWVDLSKELPALNEDFLRVLNHLMS